MTGVSGVSFAFSTKSLDGIVAEEPFVGSVTVALPWSSTVTVLPWFASWTFAFKSSCSCLVKRPGVATGSFLAGTDGVKSCTTN